MYAKTYNWLYIGNQFFIWWPISWQSLNFLGNRSNQFDHFFFRYVKMNSVLELVALEAFINYIDFDVQFVLQKSTVYHF